jgi:prepilin-type processing-associated H-X9-DG protein
VVKEDTKVGNRWILGATPTTGAWVYNESTIGINSIGFSNSFIKKLKNPKFKNPDRLMHFSDCFGGQIMRFTLTLPQAQGGEIRMWHQNSAAMVYFDGHANARKRGSFTSPVDASPSGKIKYSPFWMGFSNSVDAYGSNASGGYTTGASAGQPYTYYEIYPD